MKRFITFILILFWVCAGAISQIKLGVLLPLEENSEKGRKMVEFYQGLLLAVDSVKTQGVSVDVYAWHSGTTNADLEKVLQNPDVAEMDIIIGPGNQSQAASLSHFCQEHSIRFVMPFSATGVGIVGKPLFYQVSAAYKQTQQLAAKRLVAENPEARFVFLKNGSGDEKGCIFQQSVTEALAEKGLTPTEIPVEASTVDFDLALTVIGNNIIIPNSTSKETLTKFLPYLKHYSESNSTTEITLFGYPEWMTYTSTTLNDFYRFNTQIFTTYYRSPIAYRTAIFEKKFLHYFQRSMMVSFPRYGMMGFDLGYYFLRGMAKYGDQLENNIQNVETDPLQNYLVFERTGDNDGMVNRACLFVRYNKNHTITIEK